MKHTRRPRNLCRAAFSLYFLHILRGLIPFFFFFFNDTATTEIYTLSLHDALPIWDSDVLARLGGDEFAVLPVEASGHSEATIKTRLFECLKAISAEPSRYEISLSVGLARFDPCSRTSIGELLAKADQSMYEQKRRQSRPLLETETSTQSQ